MAEKSISIRLGTTGKAQIKADFAEIGESGDASAKRLKQSYERASEDVTAAMQRQSNAAAKIAAIMPQSPVQMQIGDRNSTGFGQYEGSARASAAAFKDLLIEQDRVEARTRALIAAVEPATAAQSRFNAEIRNAKELLDAGRISTDQYAKAEAMARSALDETVATHGRATVSAGQLRAGYQQLSFQIGDVVQSLAMGANPAQVFVQQAGQVVQAISLITGAAGGGGEGGGAGAVGAIGGMTETLGSANDAFDATSGAAERLTGVLGTGSASTEANSIAAGTNAGAHEAQAGATTTATAATTANTTATGANAAANEGAAVATTGLAAAKMRLVSFMAGPWGAAVIGGVTILGLLATKLFETSDASNLAESSMAKFQSRQSDIGQFIDSTTGKLKEQNRTLVLNAILTRQAQLADNAKQITESRNSAFDRAREGAFRGTKAETGSTTSGVSFEDDDQVQYVIRRANGDVGALAAGLGELAKRRPELAKLALDVSSIGGQAALAARENAQLAKELKALSGDSSALGVAEKGMIEARSKLAGATTAMDRAQAQYNIRIREADAAYEGSEKTAADQQRLLSARTKAERDLNIAHDANKKTTDAHGQSLARNAASMEVNAAAALDLAKAYLIGGDAALKAEAARKALTDATKRGIDGDAQTRRQLDIMIGDQLVASAKSVAQLHEETAARQAVRAAIADGSVPVGLMNQALADEAALRPLLKLQTLAQGDALTVLTKVVDEYRAALTGAHDVENEMGFERIIQDTIDKVEEAKGAIADLSLAPLDQALNAASRAAVREADGAGIKGENRAKLIDRRVEGAQVDYDGAKARFVRDALRDQSDTLALSERELSLLGVSATVRETILEKLKLEQQIRRQFPDMAAADVAAQMDGIDAIAAVTEQIERQQAALDELRDVGENAIDTIFSTSSADNWGDRLRSIIGDVKTEFLKLALINPLKNMLNGNSALPTLGGVIGKLTGLLDGVGAAAGAAAQVGGGLSLVGSEIASLPRAATGTEYSSGGATIVGEFGKEIVDMPRGARVTPAGETRRLLARNDNGPAPINHFHLEGAVVTQDLLDHMNAIGSGAATRGAAGGSALAQREISRSQSRALV